MPRTGFPERYAEPSRSPDTTIDRAGESSGLVDGIRPAADILRAVVDDAVRRLRAAAALVGD